MTILFIVCLALFGGIDQLGNASSWQFLALIILALCDAGNGAS
jgi:hypothetical protein